MGGSTSKHDKSLKNIQRQVNSIRSSVRSTRSLNEGNRHDLMNNIIRQTDEVNKLKRKVDKKKVDETMSLIQDTTRELLRSDSIKSNGSVKSQVKIRPKSLIETTTTTKTTAPVQRRHSLPTLGEIEAKLNSLKPLIVTAIQNQDRKQLRVYKETIQLLVNDLDQIPMTNRSEGRRKLQTQLSTCYQKVDKAFREISRNSNLVFLANTEQKSKLWKELDTIERDLLEISMEMQKAMTNQEASCNLTTIRGSLTSIQPRLSHIEPLDDNIKLKRLQLMQRSKQLHASLESCETKPTTRRDVDKYMENLKNLQDNIAEKSFTVQELSKLGDILEGLKKTVSEKRKTVIIESGQSGSIKSDQDLSTAAEIRTIQSKVNFFKERINQYKGNIDIQHKIQQYIEKIATYINDPNQNLASQASLVLNDLNSILIELRSEEIDDDSCTRIIEIRSIVEDKLVKLDKNPTVHQLQALIKDLQEYMNELERIVVPTNLPDYKQSQQATFDLINLNINLMNEKLSNLEESGDMEFVEEFEKLKKTVNRFNGTYRNILYNDIELKLNRLLSNVIERVHNPAVSKALKNDIQRELKILEQRSTKRQSAELEYLINENEHLEMSKIRDRIDEIKRKMNGKTSEMLEFDHFNSELNELLIIVNNFTNFEYRMELLDEIKLLRIHLAQRNQQCDLISHIEGRLNEIERTYKNNKELTQPEKDTIDERLIAMQMQLGKLEVHNDDERRRSIQCNERIMEMLRELRQVSAKGMIV